MSAGDADHERVVAVAVVMAVAREGLRLANESGHPGRAADWLAELWASPKTQDRLIDGVLKDWGAGAT